MAMTLACADAGITECPYVARAETLEGLMNDAGKHGKEVHGYTDEQLNDPEMINVIKKAIKTEQIKFQYILDNNIGYIYLVLL